MRQWWGMRRRGHTLSSKTQLVANDTTFGARGPRLRLQTRGHNGLNYRLDGYASRQEGHTHTHTRAQTHKDRTQTQIVCMVGCKHEEAEIGVKAACRAPSRARRTRRIWDEDVSGCVEADLSKHHTHTNHWGVHAEGVGLIKIFALLKIH